MAKSTNKSVKSKQSKKVVVSNNKSQKWLAVAFIVVFAMAGTIYIALSHAATYAQICDKSYARQCLRNNSGSIVTGTPIAPGSANSASYKQSFAMQYLNGYCSHGRVTTHCPFALGSGLNLRYLNDDIVQFKYVGSSSSTQCLGNSIVNPLNLGALQQCNASNGAGGGKGTIFIFNLPHGRGTPGFVESLFWSNNNFLVKHQYNNPTWLCATNNQINLASNNSPGAACQWQFGELGSSTGSGVN